MIKKLFLAVLLAMPMCLSAQTFKFGTVNTAEVFNVMPDKATAEATLKAASEKYDAEFKRLQEDFQKDYAEFEKLTKDEATPAAIKERHEKDLQDKYQKIQSFQQTASQDLQKQQETLLAPIQSKLQQAIQAVGAENGFTYIFDLSIPSIIYNGNGSQDVTPLVKAKLGIK
ncbi:MAG: OmpH family outer membrane protein [Muribaculaceae bacterium]